MADLSEIQFCRLPDGQKIAWREMGAGTPLILLHGWSMSSVVFNEVVPLLAEKYRVLCPDLPGHGQSSALEDCQLPQMSAAVAAWADLLDFSDVALLGWSLGGQVALQLAIDNRLTIKKLLLVATTARFCQTTDWQHGLPEIQIKTLARNIDRCYEKTLGDFFKLQFVGENLSKERYRQIIAFAVRTGQLPEASAAKNMLTVLAQADLRSELKKIPIPTHILHGELDQIIPFSAGEYLAEVLPKAELHSFSRVGHSPFFSCPQESVNKWLKFLQ